MGGTKLLGGFHHLLLPRLMDAQVGRVDQSTQNQVSEVVTEIFKVHPEGTDRIN